MLEIDKWIAESCISVIISSHLKFWFEIENPYNFTLKTSGAFSVQMERSVWKLKEKNGKYITGTPISYLPNGIQGSSLSE